MDIDKLFKVPKLPTGGNKRRMPDAPTPEMLKRMKLDSGEATAAPGPVSRKVTVTEVDEDGNEMDGDFAPGGDADYYAEEDEDGRFFGGGLTGEQKEILNIFDRAGDGGDEEFGQLTAPGVRKLLLRLERAAKKNADQRSKYPDDPSKFIDSEADLDAALKALLPLAQAPAVAYPVLVDAPELLEMLVGLLSHENADIALDVVEVIRELTDEDVGEEGEEDEEGVAEEKEKALRQLVKALLDHSILELLVSNMSRFDEKDEADRQGIYNILGICENIVGSNPELAERLILRTKLLSWLLNRVQAKNQDENRGYAAELLAILLQESRPNRLEFGKHDGVETLLKVASNYRKRDPTDAEETEFMENVFDALCSALGEPEIKALFLRSEGVDLMVLIMGDKMQARSRSIKTLDHALSGRTGAEACETFVAASGLKHLSSALLGKVSKKAKDKAAATATAAEDTSHALGITASLFTNLATDSPSRVRVLAKFVEGMYEKTDKLLDLRATAAARLATADREIAQERKVMEMEGQTSGPDEEGVWFLRRLENGLYTLQTVDYILAWLVYEDDGIRLHVKTMLGRRSKTFADIVTTLNTYADNLDEPTGMEGDGELSMREILANLIAILEGYQ
ncbi:unnamed protein product [Peniophora sp. CBMAI 1063]|nr:unnamed protein product [Peniophora sp. CBMAI 1063]